MEDLRKDNNTKRETKTRINIFAIINNILKYIKNGWKLLLFWFIFIFTINIIFNPKHTANTVVSWYNNFITTIIDGL